MKQKEVGIFLDLFGAYGRGIFRGLRKYAEEVGNWHCRFPKTYPVGRDVDIAEWEVDGWIGYSNDSKLTQALSKHPKPLICVSTAEAIRGNPAVVADNRAVGRMAFDYLLERGHATLGFVGHSQPFSAPRRTGFADAAEQFGRPCHMFPNYRYSPQSDESLREWLLKLPKPIGLFADNDHLGAIVLDLCRDAGIDVPNAVSVLSADNDELLCTLRLPTLSSIELDTGRIGYEAAATLDRLLNGEPPPKKPMLIPPIKVITRQSTDALAFADDEVRQAVQFIHSRANKPITVQDVITNSAVSVSTLEQRFRRQLNCSILSYIHKIHVDHAISLLISTDEPIEKIAKASGFSSATRMGIVFRKITRRSPSEHRRRSRNSIPQI